MPEVWIPPLMQRLTGGQKQVHVAGQTIRQVIDNLDQVFPGLKMELYDAEEDVVMPGRAVVIDGETSQLGLLERVREDSEIHFLPALGGGAGCPPCLLLPAWVSLHGTDVDSSRPTSIVSPTPCGLSPLPVRACAAARPRSA